MVRKESNSDGSTVPSVEDLLDYEDEDEDDEEVRGLDFAELVALEDTLRESPNVEQVEGVEADAYRKVMAEAETDSLGGQTQVYNRAGTGVVVHVPTSGFYALPRGTLEDLVERVTDDGDEALPNGHLFDVHGNFPQGSDAL